MRLKRSVSEFGVYINRGSFLADKHVLSTNQNVCGPSCPGKILKMAETSLICVDQ
jgi:hypothetical protein